jgi:hypothetical protein
VSEQLVPIHREAVIPDVLSVLVYEDEVSLGVDPDGGVTPPVPAWVFASSGLESAGQRELVLGILRITPRSRIPRITPRPRPRSPFALVSTMYQQARAGTVLEEGSRFEVRGAASTSTPVSGFSACITRCTICSCPRSTLTATGAARCCSCPCYPRESRPPTSSGMRGSSPSWPGTPAAIRFPGGTTRADRPWPLWASRRACWQSCQYRGRTPLTSKSSRPDLDIMVPAEVPQLHELSPRAE